MPFVSSVDNTQQAIQQLAHAIKNLAPASPFQLGDTQLNAIDILTKLFHNKLEAQETAASPPLLPPTKVIQQQQFTPTPTPIFSPSPTNHHNARTPHLIPTDAPVPPRERMQSQGAAQYNLRSHAIHKSR